MILPFTYLFEDTINSTINRLPYFSIYTTWTTHRKYDANKTFQRKVEKRKQILEQCNDERLNKINSEVIHIATRAFLINSGG
ncbi:hypothetical protein [Flavivirga eckloniae]|uniref:Uncharacterized protein n=1 Tax=Flavivirga eckloniae TaxID=1803846 RepID=A0A2K9PR17_9FLAO|nr:hypothetical protein [Flavivirga eckloniae]AUP79512.1 hypothetical protein C1H87_12665 [Flavivirga eckloniae]